MVGDHRKDGKAKAHPDAAGEKVAELIVVCMADPRRKPPPFYSFEG